METCSCGIRRLAISLRRLFRHEIGCSNRPRSNALNSRQTYDAGLAATANPTVNGRDLFAQIGGKGDQRKVLAFEILSECHVGIFALCELRVKRMFSFGA